MIFVRSLMCVGGTRPGRQYRRKKERNARRRGYANASEMALALAKFAGQ